MRCPREGGHEHGHPQQVYRNPNQLGFVGGHRTPKAGIFWHKAKTVRRANAGSTQNCPSLVPCPPSSPLIPRNGSAMFGWLVGWLVRRATNSKFLQTHLHTAFDLCIIYLASRNPKRVLTCERVYAMHMCVHVCMSS